jgi:hypothetical protein
VLFIHIGLVVSMAVDTGKFLIVGCEMALRAVEAAVFSGCDGELMDENRLCPQQMCGEVTEFAVGRKSGGLVVRVVGCFIIIGMTAEAGVWRNCTGSVTCRTIKAWVRAQKRPDFVVIENGSFPAQGISAVTGDAVGRETQELVVRVGGGIVIGKVATHTS